MRLNTCVIWMLLPSVHMIAVSSTALADSESARPVEHHCYCVGHSLVHGSMSCSFQYIYRLDS